MGDIGMRDFHDDGIWYTHVSKELTNASFLSTLFFTYPTY